MSSQSFLSVLTGSFSTPSADNPTVAMMEAAYRHAGLDVRYINCDVKPHNLEDAVHGARAMEWAGFNCSMPHKAAVIDFLDDIEKSAKIIGAVNCVAIRKGKLTGYNTDGKGFLASLKEVAEPEGKKILLLGAGGAARAIAVELALAGAKHIRIINRDKAKAEKIADLIEDKTHTKASAHVWKGNASVPDDVDIIINATSIGLGNAEAIPPVDLETLKKGQIVADVIPNPPVTRFLQEAKKRECITLTGLGMLVHQGIIGAEFWLGKTLDATAMKNALEDIFGVKK
ncbi:shikimate dehydrogenase [Gluconobacter wancherniae]|uniref:Shikimate dehydrogenase (NADP(+)) n=1 Tax=Gluconobacter wancherniae NBRC 103581 TaxID=656744 RepID=A0A511B2R5_9PROT|nr:shikimate dehydrogenase [Gluconobacter wancherniae]MBF0854840.1 shikimate dehydrogenase [Gluconobacter wancherniae]GBD57995.1 NADP(+)-type shikimate dehydrogenase [Gluconobacter wancherniae NBRC 103581]GBR65653.1 shikimate 5-dehydrogenase [Gluconobacter wancherniae NBRC 103581]GEK94714.1 shikimate dehydrogenase (NADP(+)) [Gluconobacter wancherniae NBRC 103581]